MVVTKPLLGDIPSPLPTEDSSVPLPNIHAMMNKNRTPLLQFHGRGGTHMSRTAVMGTSWPSAGRYNVDTNIKQLYPALFWTVKLHWLDIFLFIYDHWPTFSGGRRGRDRMVVGFTTTYAISTYPHWCCEFESRSGRGVQHYVIKFVSELWQVGGFLRSSGSGFHHQ